MRPPVRHTRLPLPAAPYVPGRGERPEGVCDGPGLEPRPLDEVSWRRNARWLWAADLHDHGFFWEAHEAWEGNWHVHGRRGFEADLLKALIQTAAAHLKEAPDVAGARADLVRSSRDLLDALRAERSTAFGLDLDRFVTCHDRWFRTGDAASFPFVALAL